tara:strand:+ start:31791 stop:33674 length:1884 start_codon:yes stop_codon:yes gene_type:complete
MINFFQNKFFLFFIFSVLSLLSYGISTWEYTIYNFDQLYYFLNSENYINDPVLQSTTFGGYFLNRFSLVFNDILQVPLLYLFSSILIKTFIYYLFYKITNSIIKKENLSIIITLFFLTAISSSSHMSILNGFWGAPIFYRSSVSGLMTLIGLLLLIDNKIIFSIIPFAISIHLHPLYGSTSFAFIFFSFVFYLYSNKKQLLNFFVLTLFIFINLIFISYNVDNTSFEALKVSDVSWYKMLMSNDPADVSVLFSIGSVGYFTILAIISSLYFVFIKNNKTLIDYLFLGSLFFLILIVFIEILHYNFIFIDYISEQFIAFQFRRGLWVIMFFSTIINFINIEKMLKNHYNTNLYFALIFLLFLFLKPDPISLFLILLTGIFYFKKNIFVLFFLISFSLLIFGIYNQYYNTDIYSILINFTFITISTFIVIVFIKFKEIKPFNVLFLILLIPVSANTIIGLYKNTFINDIKRISNAGIFKSPKILELEKNIYKSQGKKINNKIINYVRANNNNNDFVLESIDNLFYGDPIIYNSPIYISRYQFGYSLYSKKYYGNLLIRINNLISDYNNNSNINKANFFDFMDTKITNIEKLKFEKLYANYQIRFVILKKEMENYIIKENGYFLYDLKNN